ncbi:MAG: hypothetical protein IJB27_02665 [Clostridia bacterium]|nr:hypothetical protein [Clostridia bacterium]
MTEQIDSIYCFDYTKVIGHYDSLRDFASEKMKYVSLALSTATLHVDSTPVTFDIPSMESKILKGYADSQFKNLNEISKEMAVNSPKYIMICYIDGSKRYFSYSEQFYKMFKMASLYKPKEKNTEEYVSPFMIQSDSRTESTRFTRPVQTSTQTIPAYTANEGMVVGSRTEKKPTIGSKRKWAFIVGICVILLLIVVVSSITEQKSADAGLTPVSEPRSGEILSGYEVYGGSEITIRAESGHSCVVKLKTRTGTERMSFYVRAGDTVTVGVPAESLYVYFASGDTWYGKVDLFGSKTSYSMDDEIFDFSRYTCEYTLYPVSNGNFSQTPIDANAFK